MSINYKDLKSEDIAWGPHPGPQRYALGVANIRELLFGGARGGGKTDAGMVWLLKEPYISHKRYRALVIRKNADDLSDWVDRARYLYRPMRCRFVGKPPVIHFPRGAKIKTGHLKDENAYNKYLGHEYQKMLIEEATQIPRELDYLRLISSARSKYPEMPAKIFCTSNPGGAGHAWVRKRWRIQMRGVKPNVAYPIPDDGRLFMYVPSTIKDNPTLQTVDPFYEKFLDSLPEPWRTAWKEGDWTVFLGQMFNFSERHHVIKPIPVPSHAPLYMTFDWGFGAPYSIGWWWVDGEGRIYRFSELYGDMPGQDDIGIRQTDEEIAEAIVEHEQQEGISKRKITRLCDPTCFNKKPDYKGGGQGPSTAEVFAKYGIYLTPGDPNRKLKIRQFHQRLRIYRDKNDNILQPPMMQIYDTCLDFIRTIPSLEPDAHNIEDVDSSLADHCYDEACHICMARPMGKHQPKLKKGGVEGWFR